MRKLLLIIALGSAAACIEWPTDAEIRDQRCSAEPTDPGCTAVPDAGSPPDAGGNDAGMDAGIDASVDAGEDAGADAGIDAGVDAGHDTWNVAWREVHNHNALFVVGDRNGGTLVSWSAGTSSLRGFNSDGWLGTPSENVLLNPMTAAYERDGIVVAAWPDQLIYVFRRTSSGFTTITADPSAGFFTTAMDLYPLPDAGLAVAAYGELDGGLAVRSFGAATSRMPQSSTFIPCATTAMRPLRILPSPDGGPGVVVGNVLGSCNAPLSGIDNSGNGFVARFGTGISMPDAYSFAASVNSSMALGIVQDELWVAYEPPSKDGLALGQVRPTLPFLSTRLLSGTLTAVELLEVGTGSLLVGQGRGEISLADGGASKQLDGTDVFIARLASNFEVIDLQVFVAPGDQTVMGAVWTNGRLVMGGNCSAGAGGLCRDAGTSDSWLAGFEPIP